jgi:hypothetical protein
LSPVVVEDQPYHFPFFDGKEIDCLVKENPSIGIDWIRNRWLRSPGWIGPGQIERDCHFPALAPREIEQFSADMDSREIKEISCGSGFQSLKCPEKSHQAVLQNIICIGETADVGEGLEHPSGEFFKTCKHHSEQIVGGCSIASPPSIEAFLKYNGIEYEVWHRPTSRAGACEKGK